MIVHFFVHCQQVARTVWVYYPALVRATLLRVVQQGGLYSCLVPTKTGTVRFFPLFFLNKVYLNTLFICLSWLLSRVQSGQSREGSAPFLGFLSLFDVSNIFEGGFEWVRDSFQLLLRDISYLSRTIFSGISSLVAGSLSVLPLVWWRFFLGGIACPPVPCVCMYVSVQN